MNCRLNMDVMKSDKLLVKAKALYAYLCLCAGSGDSCSVGRKQIAEDLGMCCSAFSRSLNSLIEHGVIEVERPKNVRCCNIYHLTHKVR